MGLKIVNHNLKHLRVYIESFIDLANTSKTILNGQTSSILWPPVGATVAGMGVGTRTGTGPRDLKH